MTALATAIGRGTNGSRPAAGSPGRLYYDTTNSQLQRDNGSSWDSVEGAGGLSDQGIVTYLDFTTAAAPSSPAAGKIRVYSKTGDHLAQKSSGGTETLLDSGGGGVTQAYIGKNAVGASTETVGSNSKAYAKSVTLANACVITSIGAHLSSTAGTIGPMSVGLYTDNSGVPQTVIGWGPWASGMDIRAASRWVDLPLGVWVASGTYWIAVRLADTGGTVLPIIDYDTGGGDFTMVPGTNWIDWVGSTNSTRDYSIRANTIR